ncbi:DUF2161 domain-containing phosphodiesterase [Aureimonas sp. AU40]|uniref:DUF2161 domain-containing phosphodiesterase n=1 Tax=Aureimonas sp. AU40 TaxID=1637747 RepID=UPI000AFC9626|nr:DUF2161 family putative PD-(D/E)XK-type phosphodiesterase [Aureimonas sp. AU40]
MSTVPIPAGETALYLPVKRFLETLGFDVKGEIGACDLLALKEGKPAFVVVCELKLQFNLELVLQGVDRAPAVDEVWLAARLSPRGKGREGDRRFRDLCRRLGFGLLGVDGSDRVQVLLSPDSPSPRKNPKRRSQLVSEHRRREGDPAVGGGSRRPVMTAYRQEALRCAAALAAGASRPRDLRPACPRALAILRRNVYGWFANPARGLYTLTPAGFEALERWPQPRPEARSEASAEALSEP